MALTQTQVSELYVAVFGRASEGEGNAYWATFETTESAATEMFTLDVVSDYFSVSNFTEEANVRTVVEAIYLNALGKAPADDVEGIQYWVDSIIVDGNAMGVMVAGLVASANDPVNAGAAQDTFNNKVEVSNYTADTIETFTDFATFQGFIASVDETSASVDTAKTSVDGSSAFSLTTGLAALETAQDAVAAFLVTADGDDDAATSTTEAAVAALVTEELDDVNDEVAGYTAGSEVTRAALLAGEEGVRAATAADAQAALDAKNAEIAEVTGLTAAIAAVTAAEAAEDAAVAAAAATAGAVTIANTTFETNSDLNAVIDGSDATNGVLAVNIDDATSTDDASGATPFTNNDTLTLTKVVDGVASLVDADDAWNADQVAFFEALQTADVVAAIDAFNANAAADTAVTNAGIVETAADATVDYLDVTVDAGYTAALEALGAGFTLTAVADEDSPLESEVLAEVAALAAAEAAAVTLAADTETARLAAVASDTAADDAVIAFDALVLTYDNAVAANAANTDVVDSYAALTAYSAADFPVIGDGAQATIIAADAATQVTITAEDTALAAVVTGTQADLTAANTADTAADTAETNATNAEATFVGLVGDLATQNADSPLTGALAGLQATLDTAELAVTVLADAVAALAAANVNADALAALNETVDAATTALTDEGYNVVDVDAASEFGTADDDVFLVGSTSSSIYSINTLGSDVVSIGTGYTLNTDEVAAANGDNAVLEAWITESGADTVITLETEAFSSNSAEAETTITLIGVAVADVTLADGYITVA